MDLNEFNGNLEELRTWAAEGIKKEDDKVEERDISKVSPWAADAWEEVTKNGYFDGSRPGDVMTREEVAIVVNRLRRNILLLIMENQD
ncbi:hypothetical protein [Paenibacillus sp. SN-8-1]|uniref:hypothetical protein n=1 Tax=Paenibacillus sp. SN-8-1 TaxID=3435409 RepID=UPI003D9A83AA